MICNENLGFCEFSYFHELKCSITLHSQTGRQCSVPAAGSATSLLWRSEMLCAAQQWADTEMLYPSLGSGVGYLSQCSGPRYVFLRQFWCCGFGCLCVLVTVQTQLLPFAQTDMQVVCRGPALSGVPVFFICLFVYSLGRASLCNLAGPELKEICLSLPPEFWG